MIYENETLTDSSNPGILEFRANKFSTKEFRNVLASCCQPFGLTVNKDVGEYINRRISLNNKSISFWIQYDNRIQFYENSTLGKSVITFQKPMKKSKTKEAALGVFTLDITKLKTELENKVEQSKLRKQNKNVSEFKAQIFAPYIEGVFKDLFPDCSIMNQSRFSYRIDFKFNSFHIYIRTKAMSKLDFSLVDFDEIPCEISIYKGITVYINSMKLKDVELFKNGLPEMIKKLYERYNNFISEKTKRQKQIEKLKLEYEKLKILDNELTDNFYTTTKDIKW